ncbi:MAG: hypothetical protein M5U16_01525 [Hyphomicrobium sp.]|nr:hypothetical protein [Hyphomicrobium sp.]
MNASDWISRFRGLSKCEPRIVEATSRGGDRRRAFFIGDGIAGRGVGGEKRTLALVFTAIIAGVGAHGIQRGGAAPIVPRGPVRNGAIALCF